MKMKLMQLKIRNFMGCKELDIEFAGSNMKVYGDNATGKTTLQHAFNWLLFDKNAYAKTDFGIKPVDSTGNVIHRLETSVEALFDVDGQPKLFKKVFKEKWTRTRGAAEESYSGNTVDYYVNTIPKKKKEFTDEISNLIDENVFRMITNPLYFNESIDWKTRRQMLLDICGDISDKDVIASDEELAPLLNEILKGHTIEEVKSMVSSELKSINKELGVIPSRIAEAELAKPTPRNDVDVSNLEALEQQLKEKVQEKSDIINGAEILRMKAEFDNLKRDAESVKAEVWNKFSADEYKELQEAINKANELVAKAKNIEETTIPGYDMKLEINSTRKGALSKAWDDAFKKAFIGTKCPTCKQELPPDQLEVKRADFNTEKARTLDKIEQELKLIKEDDNSLYYKKAEAKSEIDSMRSEYEALGKRAEELSSIMTAKENEFQDRKDKRINELNSRMNDLRNSIVEHQLNAEELAKGVDVEIKEIEKQISPIKEYLAEVGMIARQDARIEELKAYQMELSGRYTVRERTLYLTEKFTRCKVAMLNERVNSRFKYARFKLFHVQENGGIAETCEATYDGVPYRDLNTAGKINIGLDIINTLSTDCGISAPIFIDNMESVTRPIETNAQMIKLIVSEKDKTLRFEKED